MDALQGHEEARQRPIGGAVAFRVQRVWGLGFGV